MKAVLRKRKVDINRVLVEYNVPLIDDAGKVISLTQAENEPPARVVPRHARAPARPSAFKMPGPAATPQEFKMPGSSAFERAAVVTELCHRFRR